MTMADPVEDLLREYTSKMRNVLRAQLAADVTAAVLKALGAVTAEGSAAPPSAVSRSPSKMRPRHGDDPDLLKALLKKHSGNVPAVGVELGKARSQIYRWLAKHGIDPHSFRRGGPDATVSAKKNVAEATGASQPTRHTPLTSANEPRAAASRKLPKGKSKGGRRRPDVLAHQRYKVLAYVTANPGQRAAQISKATKISTEDLRFVLRKLLADTKLKTDGVTRGATYTVVKVVAESQVVDPMFSARPPLGISETRTPAQREASAPHEANLQGQRDHGTGDFALPIEKLADGKVNSNGVSGVAPAE
jgi:hypothetical protein